MKRTIRLVAISLVVLLCVSTILTSCGKKQGSIVVFQLTNNVENAFSIMSIEFSDPTDAISMTQTEIASGESLEAKTFTCRLTDEHIKDVSALENLTVTVKVLTDGEMKAVSEVHINAKPNGTYNYTLSCENGKYSLTENEGK